VPKHVEILDKNKFGKMSVSVGFIKKKSCRAKTCSWNNNLIKYKVVCNCIIYILYYILAYVQHNRDVSLENYVVLSAIASLRKSILLHSKPESVTASHDSCIAQR
jgi:hypothetical protein